MTRERPRAVDWAKIGREDAGWCKRWILERIAGEGNEGVATKELCDEMAQVLPAGSVPKLSVVAYHVQALVSAGRLEVVRAEQVRGAVQKFYRVPESVLVSGQQEATRSLQASMSRLAARVIDGPEELARRFHEIYERRAPDFGYKTREASAVPWDKVPSSNKALMVAVCEELMVGIDVENAAGLTGA